MSGKPDAFKVVSAIPYAHGKNGELLSGGRRPKLLPQQRTEVVKMVMQGKRTAADAARLFNVHPATIGRLLSRTGGDAAAAKR